MTIYNTNMRGIPGCFCYKYMGFVTFKTSIIRIFLVYYKT